MFDTKGPTPSRRKCIVWATLAAALAFGGQFLTVHFNYGGNWTGLFCTGSRFPVPPALAHEGIYIFASSHGYDGQFYHYIAHDPFFRRGFAAYVDNPPLRYRRILIPLLAWFASQSGLSLHAALLGVQLASVFLGAYWLARCFERRGLHPAWGLSFLAIPAVIISLDRTLTDGPLAALTAGFVWYGLSSNRSWLCLSLVAAPLVRETGVLLTAASLWHAAWSRCWRQAVMYGLTTLPALAWFAWVHAHTLNRTPVGELLTFPLAGLSERIFGIYRYNFPAPLTVPAVIIDWFALAGVMLALGLAVRAVAQRSGAVSVAVALYALLAATLHAQIWSDAYAYARLVSPLLVLLIAGEWKTDRRWVFLAVGLMLPRVGLQLGRQILGILHGLAG